MRACWQEYSSSSHTARFAPTYHETIERTVDRSQRNGELVIEVRPNVLDPALIVLYDCTRLRALRNQGLSDALKVDFRRPSPDTRAVSQLHPISKLRAICRSSCLSRHADHSPCVFDLSIVTAHQKMLRQTVRIWSIQPQELNRLKSDPIVILLYGHTSR